MDLPSARFVQKFPGGFTLVIQGLPLCNLKFNIRNELKYLKFNK